MPSSNLTIIEQVVIPTITENVVQLTVTAIPVKLSVFETGSPPTGPVGGNSLIGNYPAPELKPSGVTAGTYVSPSSLSVLATGIITAIVSGSGSDSRYVHDQGVPATVWNINHNLNKYPSVSVVDSALTVWEGVVSYVNLNSLTVSFDAAFSGHAYLN